MVLPHFVVVAAVHTTFTFRTAESWFWRIFLEPEVVTAIKLFSRRVLNR